MRARRKLAMLLACLLQVMPFMRGMLAAPSAGMAPSTWAIVLKLGAGAVAFLGSYHAVSGATAIVQPYTVNAQVGVPFSRQLTTSGQTAHSWSANTATNGSAVFPLTPGLFLTNSNGKIGGTPTVAMVTNITISAWENSGNRGASVSAVFAFTITNGVSGGTPPSIITGPQSQTNLVGTSATFTVTASGTAPLGYQWRYNGTNINAATASNYVRSNLQTNDAGGYSVVVTNSAGAITSSIATLTVVLPQADVVVTSTGPPSVSPNTTYNYTVVVTNLGPNAASNVAVSNSLPGTVSFVSASGGGAFGNGAVTWPAIASLASGAGNSYTVMVTSPANGTLTNSASSTSSTFDPNTANNDGTAAAAKVTTAVMPLADVAAACSGPVVVNANSNYSYTISVTNLGPSTASNVVVSDKLPTGVTFVNASSGGNNAVGTVTWPVIATLGANGVTNYTVTVTAPASGSLTNVVSSTSATSDPVAANNNGTAAASIVVTAVGQQADLAVGASGPAVVLDGSNITYTISVTNLGPSSANNVTVTDSLPSVVIFQSTSAGGTVSNGVVRWPTIAALSSGSITNFTVTVTAPSNGTFTNLAMAGSGTVDPNPANNNGTAAFAQVVTVAAPAQGQFGLSLGASITLNPQTGLYEQIVNVTNTGVITVAAVRLNVGGLRAGVQLYNAAGTNGGQPYVQYNAPLNPGQSVTFTLEFYVPDRGAVFDTLQVVSVLPSSTSASSNGSVPISRTYSVTAGGQSEMVIEFATVPGQVYTVIYSDDGMATWNAATPSITASTTVTQWIDDGPPKTLASPVSVGSRFYKVIAAP